MFGEARRKAGFFVRARCNNLSESVTGGGAARGLSSLSGAASRAPNRFGLASAPEAF